jgi:tetratricopeptide (TPR) repeat protein
MAKSKTKKSARASGSQRPTSPVASAPVRSHEWFWAALLFFAVVVVFSPVGWADYLWDDGMFVTDNPVIVSSHGLITIWTTRAADVCPLTLTLFWIEHPLWGRNPLPYHVITVLLHGGSALVLWQLLKLLRVPGAWLGAALWALHPVNVESVAWIAETKNTLSGLFYLLSAYFFVKSMRAETTKPSALDANYAWSLLFAMAAMAAKSSTVILPVALGLIAWWIDGRWQWRRLIQLAPMFFFAIIAGLASMWTQHLQQLDVADVSWKRSWPERLVTAGDAIWFYLGKLVWPDPLMMIYPRWQIDAANPLSWLPLVAALALLTLLWFKRNSPARPWFIAYAYFLIAIFPVAGLLDNYFSQFSFVADHFQYLASIGPLVLAGAGIARCADLFSGKQWLPIALGAVVATVLAVVSWNRAWVFETDETMWSDTLGKNPACWAGANDLGNALMKKGDVAGATAQYQKALEIRPRFSDAENNLGDVAYLHGNVDEAVTDYRLALAHNPHYADASYNIAFAELQRHQTDDAMKQLQATLAIDPNFIQAHYNMGNILLDKNQTAAAIAEFRKTIELKPDHLDARNNLAAAFVQAGRDDEAVAQFEEILRYDPTNARAQENLRRVQAAAKK